MTALDAFGRDRSTLDDATWLRSIYPKIDNTRIKARIVSAVARIGGEQNEQWLISLAKNEDESIDVRQNALRYVARTVDIASLGKFYDGVSARPLREEIVNALADRKEPEATDKLIEIARSGTDPQVRRTAISTLTRKGNDPRTDETSARSDRRRTRRRRSHEARHAHHVASRARRAPAVAMRGAQSLERRIAAAGDTPAQFHLPRAKAFAETAGHTSAPRTTAGTARSIRATACATIRA